MPTHHVASWLVRPLASVVNLLVFIACMYVWQYMFVIAFFVLFSIFPANHSCYLYIKQYLVNLFMFSSKKQVLCTRCFCNIVVLIRTVIRNTISLESAYRS